MNAIQKYTPLITEWFTVVKKQMISRTTAVTHRKLYHASQIKVWATKVLPRSSPDMDSFSR